MCTIGYPYVQNGVGCATTVCVCVSVSVRVYGRRPPPHNHPPTHAGLEHKEAQMHLRAWSPAPRAAAYGPAACGGTVPKRKVSMLRNLSISH